MLICDISKILSGEYKHKKYDWTQIESTVFQANCCPELYIIKNTLLIDV